MGLPSLVSRTPRSAEEDAAESVRQFVCFRIGEEEFGIDILMLQEIIRLPGITPIPNAPEFILGMINLRGRIIPVIDLRMRLRIRGSQPGENTKKTRILIVEMHSKVTGFIVDSVSEVLKAPVSRIEPAPYLFTSNIDAEYIAGVIKLPNRLITLIDFQLVLQPRERQEMKAIEMLPAGKDFEAEHSELDISLNIFYKDRT